MIPNGLKWPQIVLNGPKWSKLVQSTEVPEHCTDQTNESHEEESEVEPDGSSVSGSSLVQERLLSDSVQRCSSESQLPVVRSSTACLCAARDGMGIYGYI